MNLTIMDMKTIIEFIQNKLETLSNMVDDLDNETNNDIDEGLLDEL